MNYFAQSDAASRYVSSRPYIHPTAIAHIKNFLNLQQPVTCALDVACGTGLSSLALTVIASKVIGIDPAEEMLHLLLNEVMPLFTGEVKTFLFGGVIEYWRKEL